MKVDKETARLWQECKKADEEMYKDDTIFSYMIATLMFIVFLILII
jgi:hypothetical protein